MDNIELPTVKHEEKDKYCNVFKDGNESGPVPLQNRDFPEESGYFKCSWCSYSALKN